MRLNLASYLALSSIIWVLIICPQQKSAHGESAGLFSEHHLFDHPETDKALPPIDEDRYPSEPLPDDTQQGGIDRSCLSGNRVPPLTSLVPVAYESGGLTQFGQPTLWFYLPFEMLGSPEYNRTIVVELSSLEKDSLIQERRYISPVPTLQKGFVGISLKNSDVILPVDEPLHWRIEIHCGGPRDVADTRNPHTAIGWIRRVEALASSNIDVEAEAAESLSHAYLESGLWYDAINVLGTSLLETGPDDEVNSAWQQLLVDGGFEDIATEVMVQFLELPSE